jgi:hypothetical protein
VGFNVQTGQKVDSDAFVRGYCAANGLSRFPRLTGPLFRQTDFAASRVRCKDCSNLPYPPQNIVSKNPTRDNHYMPRGFLKAWTDTKGDIWEMARLVSHPSVPCWTPRKVSGTGYLRDLYTEQWDGEVGDSFETWICDAVETTGTVELNKLRRGVSLSPSEWTHVGRYLLALDLRTPSAFFRLRDAMQKAVPPVAKMQAGCLHRKIVDNLHMGAGSLEAAMPDVIPVEHPTKIEVKRTGGALYVGVTILGGRALWLASVRGLIEGSTNLMPALRWSIWRPCEGHTWPLSDRPVQKLKLNHQGLFSDRMSWGEPCVEIVVPISPTQLLYTKVGELADVSATLDEANTRKVQRMIVSSADQYVYANRRDMQIASYHSRSVSSVEFDQRKSAVAGWLKEQLAIESGPLLSVNDVPWRHNRELKEAYKPTPGQPTTPT